MSHFTHFTFSRLPVLSWNKYTPKCLQFTLWIPQFIREQLHSWILQVVVTQVQLSQVVRVWLQSCSQKATAFFCDKTAWHSVESRKTPHCNNIWSNTILIATWLKSCRLILANPAAQPNFDYGYLSIVKTFKSASDKKKKLWSHIDQPWSSNTLLRLWVCHLYLLNVSF